MIIRLAGGEKRLTSKERGKLVGQRKKRANIPATGLKTQHASTGETGAKPSLNEYDKVRQRRYSQGPYY